MIYKVLVVDDEPGFCEAFREHLEGKGYQVTMAYDGDHALAAYVNDRPDIVFLDVRMPGKDGIQTLREIKALDPEANVMLVTAVLDIKIMEQALTTGAFDFTFKPLNFDSVSSALKLKFGQPNNSK